MRIEVGEARRFMVFLVLLLCALARALVVSGGLKGKGVVGNNANLGITRTLQPGHLPAFA